MEWYRQSFIARRTFLKEINENSIKIDAAKNKK
jgi:hypothetical protein